MLTFKITLTGHQSLLIEKKTYLNNWKDLFKRVDLCLYTPFSLSFPLLQDGVPYSGSDKVKGIMVHNI